MSFYGILPEVPTFGQQFARNLSKGVSSGTGKAADFAMQMALEKQKSHSLANQTKHLEKVKSLETGLGTIGRMRELLHSAGPSNWISGLMQGETTRDRSELAQLGTSLIPLASAGVSIRNQKEFDQYKKVITNPNSTQAQFAGALDGLERIIQGGLDSPLDGKESDSSSRKPSKEKQKFDISNPQHKSRRDQVLKKTKNDRKKAEMILSEEFDL